VNKEVDGKPYREMHVDGGASAQVFLYNPQNVVAELPNDDATASDMPFDCNGYTVIVVDEVYCRLLQQHRSTGA
jgi:hypothetical protein